MACGESLCQLVDQVANGYGAFLKWKRTLALGVSESFDNSNAILPTNAKQILRFPQKMYRMVLFLRVLIL